ncbi:hypothetical protein LSTR_LSTR004272 [Laodelphax striatellus]|uniref:Protein PET100 homolog, mitochondrial n=1 Tax=Laodelphax striatellus TaxID=195883 RepID=A0A482WI78_LAOST|nr:hypothetical protein LSTR_LSTR004272 [Laodelphax striatellus]
MRLAVNALQTHKQTKANRLETRLHFTQTSLCSEIMARWKMEIWKMAIYMIFPVGCFHLFNQPQLFEEYVLKVKKEMYPPVVYENEATYKKAIREINAEDELKRLKALEKSLN